MWQADITRRPLAGGAVQIITGSMITPARSWRLSGFKR
jgi:hypothetical protein